MLVRGVRDGEDALAEAEHAALNRGLAPDVTTFLVPTDERLKDVSASEVRRRLARGEPVLELCPPEVALLLEARRARDDEVRP